MAVSNVAEETFEVLRRSGVDRAFGNPGSTEMHMFAYWPSGLDYVLALREASVGAMADGYAQRSGRPGFVNVHTAAGLGNGMGPVVSAARNNTPLLITAETRSGLFADPVRLPGPASPGDQLIAVLGRLPRRPAARGPGGA